ncbi:MAG: N-acyl homoserine lactonase family protein [Alphaproteobacteria bacterium]
MTTLDRYKIYAVRYATREARRAEHFLGGDPHDAPMAMDYFVWAVVGERRTFVIDTGFGAAEAARRERTLLRPPAEGLGLVGVDAGRVEDVVITHLHYDHAGTLGDFPAARFHLQDLEMAYATGRHMCHEPLRHAFEVDHVVDMVRLAYGGRVCFHDRERELAPGLSLHHVGGHTMGLQVVRVFTERGWVVLASDASHFYANMEETRPFPIVFNVGDMIEAFATLRRLADSPAHIVPGHDPLVLQRYPPAAPELEGVVARLDLAPDRA